MEVEFGFSEIEFLLQKVEFGSSEINIKREISLDRDPLKVRHRGKGTKCV